MTVLEPKSDRDQIGIDSFERGIVYAALLLYKAIKDPNNPVSPSENPFFNAVVITMADPNAAIATLSITANLPIDRVFATELGGNYLESLGVFGSTDPNPLDVDCPASGTEFIPIVQEPETVTNLEQYFYWICSTVKSNLVTYQPNNSDKVTIQFFNENPEYPRVRIQTKIPIDYAKYLRDNSLLCSVKSILQNAVPPFVESEEPTAQSLMNNSSLMNNEFLMGNGSTSSNNTNLMNNSTLMNNTTLMEN